MRGLLSWLLLLGVIAGLGGRVFGLDHVHPKDQSSHCCGHDHDSEGEDRSHDGLPPGSHDHPHTHACCHPAPLAGAELTQQRLLLPDAVWLRVAWFTALPPDEPVFALDKPPLI